MKINLGSPDSIKETWYEKKIKFLFHESSGKKLTNGMPVFGSKKNPKIKITITVDKNSPETELFKMDQEINIELTKGRKYNK